VLATFLRLLETVGFQQPQNCGYEKPHKRRSPIAVFRSPIRLPAVKRKQTCQTALGTYGLFSQWGCNTHMRLLNKAMKK
jgi:hypothetical protein